MRTKLQALSPIAVLTTLATIAAAAAGCSDAAHPTDAGPTPTAPAFAGAGPPLNGSGSGTITALEITSNVTAGGNRIQTRRLEGTLTGALEGTFTEHVRGVVHSTGLVTFQGTMEFTGTVADCGSGSILATVSGQGVAGAPVTDASFRIVNQEAGTLAVSGTGTQHQVGPSITYEVQYVCR